jgi:GT2 family glycosyltransferase/glycosyltransferase involved in cell wall biosynthesis
MMMRRKRFSLARQVVLLIIILVILKKLFWPSKSLIEDPMKSVLREKRLLFVDDGFLDPKLGSGFPRTVELLNIFAKTFGTVFFLQLNPNSWSQRHHDFWKMRHVHIISVADVDTDSWVRESKFDFLVISRIHNMELFASLPSFEAIRARAFVIYDTETLDYVRSRSYAQTLPTESMAAALENAARSFGKERRIQKAADMVWLMSQTDVNQYDQDMNEKRGKAVVVSTFETLYDGKAKTFTERDCALFVGGFNNNLFHNGDAVVWFVSNVFPLVRKAVPDFCFVIAGSRMPKEIKELKQDGVLIQEDITDQKLSALLQESRLFLMPHQYGGAGLQLKTIKALAHGLPVVHSGVTGHSFEFDAEGRDGALGAASAESMAEEICRIYLGRYLWEKMHEGAKLYVKSRFSRSHFTDQIFLALNRVVKLKAKARWEVEGKVGSANTACILEFPPLAKPPVIAAIVTAHNNWKMTLLTLKSLRQQECSVPFEVIVIDDISTDETEAMLKKTCGIKIHRNPAGKKPLRYARGINLGTKLASDSVKAFWFLNNDIRVDSKALGFLFDRLQQKNVALTGPIYLDPDGSVQEAGSMIFRDGATEWVAGPNAAGADSEYQYARPVDYISGAATLVWKEAFLAVGKYEEETFPMYFEDTDLAMKIWNHLKQEVWYEPKAIVTHWPHSTSVSGSHLKNMADGGEIFKKRWATELQSHYPNLPELRICARDRRLRACRTSKRVLMCGKKTESVALMEEMAKWMTKLGHVVTLLASTERVAYLRDMGVQVIREANWELIRNNGAAFYDVVVHDRDCGELKYVKSPIYELSFASGKAVLKEKADIVEINLRAVTSGVYMLMAQGSKESICGRTEA